MVTYKIYVLEAHGMSGFEEVDIQDDQYDMTTLEGASKALRDYLRHLEHVNVTVANIRVLDAYGVDVTVPVCNHAVEDEYNFDGEYGVAHVPHMIRVYAERLHRLMTRSVYH